LIYENRTRKEIEALFEEAGFEFTEEAELVYEDDDNSFAAEVYWKLRSKEKESKEECDNLDMVE